MHSYLGFAIFFISLGSVVATYLIATLKQGLYFFLPSISETADFPPASSIFTFFMGLSNFFIALSVYIRYKDLDAHLLDPAPRGWNIAAMIAGLVMCVALHTVTSFQQATMPWVHYPAALLLFLCSVVYMWTNAFISLHMVNQNVRPQLSRLTVLFRFLIAAVQSASILASAIFSLLWYLEDSTDSNMFWWSLNAVGEYTMSFCLGFFWIALFPEFRNLNIDVKLDWLNDRPSESSPLLN